MDSIDARQIFFFLLLCSPVTCSLDTTFLWEATLLINPQTSLNIKNTSDDWMGNVAEKSIQKERYEVI